VIKWIFSQSVGVRVDRRRKATYQLTAAWGRRGVLVGKREEKIEERGEKFETRGMLKGKRYECPAREARRSKREPRRNQDQSGQSDLTMLSGVKIKCYALL
jgi:hypothetical protein